VFLFEFIYKRAVIAVQEAEDGEDADDRQEHDALISPTDH